MAKLPLNSSTTSTGQAAKAYMWRIPILDKEPYVKGGVVARTRIQEWAPDTNSMHILSESALRFPEATGVCVTTRTLAQTL
ncbi:MULTISPECIES: hypothetical protein [Streptomyces]|uniref:Uncharacterized protein n=1 Tax=Streptomyces sp. NBC_00093 TaxID=2975649 RepID=A0AAU1ZVD0_9ACTN